MEPETRYAKTRDGVHIAYQVRGDGPIDLVFTQGFVSNVDLWWEMPTTARLLERLASFSRLILWDKRGTGLSDPAERPPTLDQRLEDLEAVMEAVGSERAALFGISEGGPMSLLFAASHPERTAALVLYASTPKFSVGPDWNFGWDGAQLAGWLDEIDQSWGEGALATSFAPTWAGNEHFRQSWGRFLRAGASPAMARAVFEAADETDCRDILPAVHVPTLILHRTGDRMVNVEAARYMAERIPGARIVEFPGDDHNYTVGDSDSIIDEVEAFLTGVRPTPVRDRVLATVLFTDIVDSTPTAERLGDARWNELLNEHHDIVRRELKNFRGREVKTMGDGFLAVFESPARALHCARAVRDGVRRLDIEIRAGVHTGECDIVADDVSGVAVAIGARIQATAGPSEILVSGTVRELVVGSGIQFRDHGVHNLKGVEGDWHLFAVSS